MIKAEYDGAMRQLGLSMLMVIALAVSGVANAMSFADCPMASAQAAGAAVPGHDCCPDGAPGAPGDETPTKMTGCFVGQACRTAPALVPKAAPLRVSAPPLQARLTLEWDPVLASRAPDAFWRPPRTI